MMVWKKLLISVTVIYFVIIFYIFFKFISDHPPDSHADFINQNTSRLKVEIWSKAAIGLYLWEHILTGKVHDHYNGLLKTGVLKSDKLDFTFRTGPGFQIKTAPTDIVNLVLVLNGRDDEKMKYSKLWLDFIHESLVVLKNLVVVLHGNEDCQNFWIIPYLRRNKGKIDGLFLVYDDEMIDDINIFQWPLGVATYRNFQKLSLLQNSVEKRRPYVCNYVATIYANSSRVTLLKSLLNSSFKTKCIISARETWWPQETVESLGFYINSLNNSDLTLCPVGQNSESYRIYEAASLGSIPVIEDVSASKTCGKIPFRLLKAYDPPFIFITDWSEELDRILENEVTMPAWKKVIRRKDLIDWYQTFLTKLRNQFLSVVSRIISDNELMS